MHARECRGRILMWVAVLVNSARACKAQVMPFIKINSRYATVDYKESLRLDFVHITLQY